MNRRKIFLVLKEIGMIAILSLVILIVINSYQNVKKKKELANCDVEFTELQSICELATVKTFYHNVAEYEKEANGLFSFLGVGYKKIWLEYTGIIEVGIDFSKVEVDSPDESGTIKVFVPDAQIINVTAENTSIDTAAEETGIFTEVTANEKAEALSEAQKYMEQNARKDTTLLYQAHQRAKKLIKEYIHNQGKLLGKEYQVVWKEE